MLDKVVILNCKEAVLVYTHRKPLRLYSDYDIHDLVIWFLDDKIVNINEFDEYRRAIKSSVEDTQEIKIA